jgi:hypothetical protein
MDEITPSPERTASTSMFMPGHEAPTVMPVMPDVMDQPAPAAPEAATAEQEAPRAIELRGQARSNLAAIKEQLLAAEQDLSPQAVANLLQRLISEVQTPLLQAEKANADRRALTASNMVHPLSEPYVQHEGVVVPQSHVQLDPDAHPLSGGGRVNS